MLQFKNIEKSFIIDKKAKTSENVLKNISADFPQGKMTAILGSSGSGKSTLLNILAGLDTDYKGEVLYNGKNIKSINQDLYRSKVVGFIFQNFNLFESQTVKENVLTVLAMSSKSSTEKDAIIKAALTKVGMEKFINKKVSLLSGGQKQRIAIARTLAGNPDVIIADEPTGALDLQNRDEVLEILKSLAREGKTVVVVTHDHDVAKNADGVITLDYGHITNVTGEQSNSNNIKPNDISRLSKQKLGLSVMFKKAVSNLTQKKFRTLLVAFGTSIGIMAVIISLGLGSGLSGIIDGLAADAGSKKTARATISKESAIESAPLSQEELYRSLDEDAKAIENNVKIQDLAKMSGVLPSDVKKVWQLSEENQENLDELSENSRILAGEAIKTTDDSAIALTTADLATLEGIDKSEIEKNLSNYVNKEYKVGFVSVAENGKISKEIKLKLKSILKSPALSGSGSQGSQTTLKVVPARMNEATAKKIKSEYDETKLTPLQYSRLYVFSSQEYSKNLLEKSKEEKYSNNGLSVFTVENAVEESSKQISQTVKMFTAVGSLALLTATFMILIVLYTSVVERFKEIGILRALGYRKLSVITMVIVEAILIVLLANVIGVIVASILAPGLASSLGSSESIKVTPQNIAIILGVTTFIGILSSLYPAYLAAKIDPIKAIKSE